MFSKHQISNYATTHINGRNGIDNRVASLFCNITPYQKLITADDTSSLSLTDRKVEGIKHGRTTDTVTTIRYNVTRKFVSSLLLSDDRF